MSTAEQEALYLKMPHAELAALAATEMGPVKNALLAIGAVLLGIAALLYGIYKVVSMANGRK